MAFDLHAEDILKNHQFRNWSAADVCRLLRHYGFEKIRSNAHIIYIHRDYGDLRQGIPHHPGEIDAAIVEETAKLCLEVKQRNARNKKEQYTPVPSWIRDSLHGGMFVEQEDHSLIYEHGDKSGEDADASRAYRLMLKEDVLTIRSIDLPEEESHFRITGARNRESGLQHVFSELDGRVKEAIAAAHAEFAENITRAQENRGFRVTREIKYDPNGGGNVSTIILDHPICRVTCHIPAPEPGKPVSEASRVALRTALAEQEGHYCAQQATLDALEERGWQHQFVKGNAGRPGILLFTHSGTGEEFSLPTHGALEMFNAALAMKYAAKQTPGNCIQEATRIAAPAQGNYRGARE